MGRDSDLAFQKKVVFSAARLDLDLQPRDKRWAEAKEQSIHSFLENNQRSTHFEIQHVECRQSLCQIWLIAPDNKTADLWDQVSEALSQQTWFDFNSWGTGANYSDFSDPERDVVMVHRLKIKKD